MLERGCAINHLSRPKTLLPRAPEAAVIASVVAAILATGGFVAYIGYSHFHLNIWKVNDEGAMNEKDGFVVGDCVVCGFDFNGFCGGREEKP